MLASLLVGAALARPPQLGLALGPVVGGGTSTLGTYFSAAPATALTVTWHLGPLESWVGASGSLLMAGSGTDVVPASLLQGELGLGFGGPGVGAGFYGGNGWPGAIVGLYARATLPRKGWMARAGVESRLFYTQATDSTGLSVMLRVEPAWFGARQRRVAEEPPAEPRGAGADGGVEVAPPAPEAGGTRAVAVDRANEVGGGAPAAAPTPQPPAPWEPVAPADASASPPPDATPVSPASDPPPPTHHDEPY